MESYEIPRFYRILNSLGVSQLPPHSDFEVYRGKFDGGMVVIFYTGKVIYPAFPEFENLINQAVSGISSKNHTKKTKYTILAKPLSSTKYHHYNSDHLNIWLTMEQYYKAIDYFSNNPKFNLIKPQYEFEEKVFERNGNVLSFHRNGKIISEHGFNQFAPFLRSIIEGNLPFNEYDLIIGQDEVGNGEKIGPLVISSVAATPRQMVDLQLAGIKDGKMVPHKITNMMSNWVRDLSTSSQVWKLDPKEYNELALGEQFRVKDILTWGHTKTFYGILHKLRPLQRNFERVLLVVDQFDKYQVLQDLENDIFLDIDIIYLPQAEKQSMSVAAASVLSKATRYRWIQMHEKAYQVKLKRQNFSQLRTHPHAHELLKGI